MFLSRNTSQNLKIIFFIFRLGSFLSPELNPSSRHSFRTSRQLLEGPLKGLLGAVGSMKGFQGEGRFRPLDQGIAELISLR